MQSSDGSDIMNQLAIFKILAVFCTVGGLGSAASDPCKLPAENISLSILDGVKYYLQENKETNTRIYLGLCHTLDVESISKFCDKSAFACVTKINQGKPLLSWVNTVSDWFITRWSGGGIDQKCRDQHWRGTEGHHQHSGSQVHRRSDLR